MRPLEVDFMPGPRGWVAALGHWFSAKTRERALEYIEDACVEIDERTGVVHAQVYGSRVIPYEVALALEAEPTRAACSCPVGESRTPCKHLLAVLYALDLGGVVPAQTGRMNLAFADPEAAFFVPVGPLVPLDPVWPEQTRRPSWRDRVLPPAPGQRRSARPAAIEYVLRADPIRGQRVRYDMVAPHRARLAILIATTSGPAAGPVRRKFWVDPTKSLDPEDAERIAALTGVQVVASSPSHYYQDRIDQPGVPQGIWVVADRVDEVVAPLAATGRLGWLPAGEYDPSPLTKLAYDGDGPWSFAMTMAPGTAGVVARGALVRGDQRIAIEDIEAIAGAGVVIAGGTIRRTTIDDVGRWMHLLAGGLDVPEEDVPELLATACVHHAPVLELDAIGWRSRDVALTPRVVLSLRRGATSFDAVAELRYDDMRADEPRAVALEPARREVVRRDLGAEAAATRSLRAAGGRLDRPWTVSAGRLRGFTEGAAAGGWEVVLGGHRVRTGSLVPRVKTGIDWFDVSIEASEGDAVVRAPELLAALRSDRPYVQLSDGTTVVIPPWLEARSRVLAAAAAHGDGFRFGAADALVVSSVVAASPDAEVDESFAAVRARLDRARTIAACPAPAGFVGTLRDYQAQGLGWLTFLREVGLGGCLADDMGLGKTVQILALLVGARRDGAERRPSLVVAPRSLVFHWLDEARRFAPTLRTLEWHGGGRDALVDDLPRADLVVTTYATLRRDIARFADQEFATVVLDEAQAIKNAASQTAAACRRLRAAHRLALSGTPIENRLDDLASIFNFLNPSLLGQPGVLRAVAAGETDVDQARAIGRVLRPVLLRRTKDEVLTELPPKTEVVIGCRLEGVERKRYDEVRGHYRDALLKRIERDGVAKSALVVLEALLRLRQAALHPGLLDPALAGEDSAKLDALVEHLHDVLGSGHRALVFSQFTTLLAIVRRRLDREGIGHEYLDGQTRDRRERVAAFQAGSAGVFLISLKAGGTGLNLTAADHVFLLDPWWNPAVEAQAIDRVHRIGQSRPVTAYRLVAENTVEARILALQDHKRALFTGVFEDKGVVGRLTVDDIRALLD